VFTCIDGGLNCVFKSLTADCELIHTQKKNSHHENEREQNEQSSSKNYKYFHQISKALIISY
jgi:hypothetical protein